METGQKSALLRQWVEEYTDDLLNWAYHKTSNLTLAEDLTQDTFLVAHQRMDHFRKESSPKTWLFAILKNKIIDHYRRQYKTPAPVDINHFREEGFTPFDSEEKWISHHAPVHWESNDQQLLDNPAFSKILEYCMGVLPSKWRLALELKFFQEKKGDAISQELGMSTSNYWQVVHRAKLQLRDCLEVNWFKNRKDD